MYIDIDRFDIFFPTIFYVVTFSHRTEGKEDRDCFVEISRTFACVITNAIVLVQRVCGLNRLSNFSILTRKPTIECPSSIFMHVDCTVKLDALAWSQVEWIAISKHYECKVSCEVTHRWIDTDTHGMFSTNLSKTSLPNIILIHVNEFDVK